MKDKNGIVIKNGETIGCNLSTPSFYSEKIKLEDGVYKWADGAPISNGWKKNIRNEWQIIKD
jgi:hypothetical protein